MIYLGADHRGFKLKEEIKSWLKEQGIPFEDMGASALDPEDDYPDFALAVAEKVTANADENRGILFCGSGMGMDVAANKVKGIRATVAYSRESAKHARTNDNVNVITLAGDSLGLEEAKEMVKIFLTTEFSGEERHARRLRKIAEIEKKNFR